MQWNLNVWLVTDIVCSQCKHNENSQNQFCIFLCYWFTYDTLRQWVWVCIEYICRNSFEWSLQKQLIAHCEQIFITSLFLVCLIFHYSVHDIFLLCFFHVYPYISSFWSLLGLSPSIPLEVSLWSVNNDSKNTETVKNTYDQKWETKSFICLRSDVLSFQM